MGKVTWRGLTGHPVQFLLAVLAIALGAGAVFGLLGLGAGLKTTYQNAFDPATAADIYVVPSESAIGQGGIGSADQALLPANLVSTLIQPSSVKGILPLYTGPLALLDRDHQPVRLPFSASFAPAGIPVLPSYAQSIGVNADPMGVQGVSIVSGTWPKGSSEIGLEQSTAAAAGYQVGDAAEILAGGKTYQVTVAGIVAYPRPVNGQVIVVLDPSTAQNLLNPSGYVPVIAISLADGADPAATATALQAIVPAGVSAQVIVGSRYDADARHSASQVLSRVSAGLSAAAILALVVAGWAMTNVFLTLGRRRAAEVAVLRQMGLSQSGVSGSVVRQGLIVGLIGSVVGLVLGLGLFALARAWLGLAGFPIGASGWLTPWVIICPIIAGVVTGLLAAIVPARRLANRPAVASAEPAERRTSALRLVVGVILIVIGLAGLIAVAAGAVGPGQQRWIWLVAGLVWLAGLVALNPGLVRGLGAALGWLGARLSPRSGRLARDFVARQPGRTIRASGAIIVTTALLACGLVLVGSPQRSITAGLSDQLAADYLIYPTNPGDQVPQVTISQLRQVSGVAIDVINQAPITVTTAAGDQIATSVASAPNGLYTDLLKADVVAGAPTDFPLGLTVSRTVADRFGLSVGDNLTLTVAPGTPATQEITFPISLIVDSQLLGNVIAPNTWVQTQMPAQIRILALQASLVIVRADTPSILPSLEAQLNQLTGPVHSLTVASLHQYVASRNAQAGQLWPLVGGWAVVSLLVILVSVAGGLGTSVSRRRAAIGSLRAIGLTKSDISWSVLLEGSLLGWYGGLIGIVGGTVIGLGAQRVWETHGLGRLSIPVLWLAVTWLCAAVAGFLGAILPARQATRQAVVG